MILGSGWFGKVPRVGEGPSRPPRRPPSDTQTQASFDLPPIDSGGFANTDAEFVGSAMCRRCHTEQHASYLQTTHSRALGEVILSDEPDDAEFEHKLSGRSYKIYRKANQMWHRESIQTDGKVVVLADYPMRYTIGSGHHSRSYLVEADGFLVESPVTWYTSRDSWDMSPGYDRAFHQGFERLANVGCLICHAGKIEGVDGNSYKVAIHEQTIGCENCHGPGGVHVKLDFDRASAEEIQASIVNPESLPRERAESICAQCHLRGDASVMLRGRDFAQFRPGMNLSAVRVDYVLQSPHASMEVVGHVEQMRLSRCYKESAELTCTTCHDPHDAPREARRAEYFRSKCLNCHDSTACGIEEDERLRRDASDNCVSCHMPRSATDIPHFAFTHHRIGLHESRESPPTAESRDPDQHKSGQLVPLHDVSHLPQIERDRCLGVAYLEFSDKQRSPANALAYRRKAQRLLESVRQRGLKDPETDAALARIHWEHGNFGQATRLAEAVLGNQPTSGQRANALLVLGDVYLKSTQPARAIGPFKQLTELRRQADDWLLLAICYQQLGESTRATEAARQAVRIQPARPDLHEVLGKLYRESNDREAAARHAEMVRILSSP
jgi:hypothetical protein